MENYIAIDKDNSEINEFIKIKRKWDREKSVVNLFEEQVKKSPNNIAISFNNKDISYLELNHVANQYSNYLIQKHKIKADDLIVIKLEKSEWVIIAILAILKSGGAYVPVDTNYPNERVKYIVDDCQCKLLIDEKELLQFKKEQSEYSKENISKYIDKNSLAYVIYTSGSTGKPKGVMIEHLNLMSRVFTEIEILNFIPNTFFTTNYVFDVSLLEIFLPIVSGGTILIPTQNSLNFPLDLIGLLKTKNVNVLQGTPSFFSNLIPQINNEDGNILNEKIKLFCIGGESLNDNLVQRIKAKLPNTKINNHYGPTETTIDAIVYENVIEHKANIIGRPIENTQVYIVKSSNELALQGEIGEICISGDGVARGYLNNPKLTEEKFIFNPKIDIGKIYKTGDLGRILKTGDIEFLGRFDDQVKIRGYRIELGEIENALMSKREIESAITIVLNNETTGDNDLVSYIISKVEINFHEVREYLKQHLPTYMIPNYFVQLNEFPLTINGKIDKKALPTPSLLNSRTDHFVAPRNEIEEKLVNIWKEVLGQEKIGINDNFFELGGHSLKAMHLLSRINDELGIKITVQEIFNFPTVENLSGNLKNTSLTSELKLEPSPIKPLYECSLSQKQLIYDYLRDPLSTIQNESTTLDFKYPIDTEILIKSIQVLIDRHETFRTNFVCSFKEPKQFIKKEIDSNIRIYDLVSEINQQETLKNIIAKNESYAFNLETEPLFSFSIFKLSENDWKLNFIMHHILTDGWSEEILIKEIHLFYNAFLNGTEPSVPQINIQNKDYAEYQYKYFTDEKIEANRKYWHNVFDGKFPTINLPKDYEYKPNHKGSGNIYVSYIKNESFNTLSKFSKRENATTYMILFSALITLVNKICNTKDVLICSAFSERNNEEIKNNIGFYITPLFIRTRIDENISFKNLVNLAKQNILNAMQHSHYSIEKLIEELNLPYDISKFPLTPISLNVMNYVRHDSDPIDMTSKHTGKLNKKVMYELDFIAEEFPNCIRLSCVYRDELFKKSTIEQIVNHYIELVTQLTKTSNVNIESVNIVR